MSAPVKTATLPEVPVEVLSFAAEKGVSEWVYPVLEMTARVIADCPLRLFVECDYEDSDWQYIVLEADVKGYDSDRVLCGPESVERANWWRLFLRTLASFSSTESHDRPRFSFLGEAIGLWNV